MPGQERNLLLILLLLACFCVWTDSFASPPLLLGMRAAGATHDAKAVARLPSPPLVQRHVSVFNAASSLPPSRRRMSRRPGGACWQQGQRRRPSPCHRRLCVTLLAAHPRLEPYCCVPNLTAAFVEPRLPSSSSSSSESRAVHPSQPSTSSNSSGGSRFAPYSKSRRKSSSNSVAAFAAEQQRHVCVGAGAPILPEPPS